ncbi:hypothetical protein GBA52_013934 [Prunus armeniaca]|nr:hypothetical protein GBA52_013934 [Prunus armeniaca]
MDKDQNVESPYDGAPEECQIRPERIGKSDWDDNIETSCLVSATQWAVGVRKQYSQLQGTRQLFRFLMEIGESGAGKTETAKIAMQYLAALGGSSCGIEHAILQTSCILEAFGNAKTSRNDNASRFAVVLLKSRFDWKMVRGRTISFINSVLALHQCLKEKLKLKRASEYKYLNQSNCLAIDGVDDAEKFHMLMEALDIVRVSKKDQEHVFSMLAAVLWLGNISFQATENENHVEVLADEALTNAAMLMGCSSQDLMLALSIHEIHGANASIDKRLTLQQKNSFEQMCINYANERLQQHFNRHLFKLEQEEYELDGIDWTKVDFEDNQECLNLFEKRPLGLLSLLDVESNFSKANDLTLADKFKQHLNANSCFKAERGRAFSIRHHAGEVLYDTSGFLEKEQRSFALSFHPTPIIMQLPTSAVMFLVKKLEGELVLVKLLMTQENSKKLHPENAKFKQKAGRKNSEVKDLPSDLAELQRRVLQAEATLERKEEENAELQGQLTTV